MSNFFDRPELKRNFFDDAQEPVRPAPAQTPQPKLTRTWGETAKDLAVGVGQGTSNLLGGTGELANTLTGGLIDKGVRKAQGAVDQLVNGGEYREGPGITGAYTDLNKQFDAAKSPLLQRRQQELADTKGFFASAKKVVTDPVLASQFVAEQVPQLASMAGTARGTLVKGAEKALAKGATREAAEEAGRRSLERQLVTYSAVQEAGPSAMQARQEIDQLPQSVWDSNEEYRSRIAAGEDPAAVKESMSNVAALKAAGVGGAAGALGGMLTAGLEGRIFTKALDHAPLLSRQGAKELASTMGKEALEETIQEGGNQLGTNVGVQGIDPTRGLMDGVPEAAGTGAALGGLIGGGLHVAGTATSPQLTRGPQPPPAAQPDPLALPPPDGAPGYGTIRVAPDGTAITEPQRAGIDAQNEATGLTPDVDAARAAHPGAAPNTVPLSRGPRVPFPDAAPGSLSDALNATAESAAPPAQVSDPDGLASLAQRADAAPLGSLADAVKDVEAGQPSSVEALPSPDITGGQARTTQSATTRRPQADTGTTPTQSSSDRALAGTATARQLETTADETAAKVSELAMPPQPAGDSRNPQSGTPQAGAGMAQGPVVGSPGSPGSPASQSQGEASPSPQSAPSNSRSQPVVAEEVSPEELAARPVGGTLAVGNSTWTKQADGRWSNGATTMAAESLARVAAIPAAAAPDATSPVAAAAAEAATSPKNDRPEPTDAQKEAGNYKKGHVLIGGLDVSIENEAGTSRRPEWPPLKHHYGYIKGSVGADKDHVDVFLTDHAEDTSRPVFVVDQYDKGKFDEHKVILGAATEDEARAAYLANYSPDFQQQNGARVRRGAGAITQMTQDEFKAWVKDPAKTALPAAAPRSAEPGTAEQEAPGAAIEDEIRPAGKKRDRGFTSAASVTAAITERGLSPGDYEVKATEQGGYIGVRKTAGAQATPAKPGAALPNATAPEHVATGQPGVSVEELAQIAAEFREHIDQGGDADVTHIFDAPAKGEVVRLHEKARVYHAEHGWMTPKEARAKIDEWEANALKQGRDDAMRAANSQKIVLSLFDLSGKWSLPWEQAGYQVYRFDIQDGSTYEDPETGEERKVGDINNMSVEFFNDLFGDFDGLDVHAILAACPCTDFAVSGARHFAAKDADGRTVASIELVKKTLAAIEYFKPAVWALENPVGRIEKLTGLPPWRLSFDPNHVGDPYTKKTLIWGRFNADLPVAPVEPTEGSKMHRLYGGKSMATKNARSETPEGFAYAFFQANNAIDNPIVALAGKYDRLDRALIQKALDAGVTPAEIDALVENDYYQELDDEAAEAALRTAAAGTNNELADLRAHEERRQARIRGDLEKIDANKELAEPPPAPKTAKPTAGKKAAVVDAPKRAPENAAPVVKKPMGLLEVIARNGGLNREAFRAQGVDPAQFNMQAGIRYVFRKNGGMGLDQLQELMQQEHYLPRDPEDGQPVVDHNDVMDKLFSALAGNDVFADDQAAHVAAYLEARRQADAEYRAELESDQEFGTLSDEDFEAMQAREIADLTERAYDLGASDSDIVGAAFDSDNSEHHRQALQSIVARLENARGTDEIAADQNGRSGAAPREEAEPESGRQADGFQLDQQPAGAAEGQDREVAQQGLFAPPTNREQVEDAKRRRDAERNGLGQDEVRASQGDGELFAGGRPEQADIEQETKPNPTAEESSAVAGTVAAQDVLFDRLRDGAASLDEYKAGWKALQDNRAAIMSELEGMTKETLLKYAGSRYKSERKDQLVRAAFGELEGAYGIGRSLSWSMGDSLTDTRAAQVESTTEENLNAFADRVAESRKARAEQIAGAKDPKTLDDFVAAARLAGGEARLTPTQRAEFDRLRADARRDQRDAEAKRNALVRQVDTAGTGMALVETKHTQKGHDLFVVRMDERVERDVYDQLNAAAKRLGGHYSSYRGNGAIPGFTFTNRAAAEQFMAVREGNVDASAQQQARADAKSDRRAESLAEKAAILKEKAQELLNRERKSNTARRAAQAASAEAEARRQLALANTMERLAGAIDGGTARMLAFVRHKSQVEMLESAVKAAHWDHLRAQGVDWEKAKDMLLTADAVANSTLPKFYLSRGDAAVIARRLSATRGGKQLGDALAKQVDYGDEYGKAVQANPTRFLLSRSDGNAAIFKTKREADAALSRSADKVRGATVKLPVAIPGAGQWAVVLHPDLAIERKLWAPDYDQKVTINQQTARKIMELLKASDRDQQVPYWWSSHMATRDALAKLGIETNYEYREALREYIGLRQPPEGEDRVRKLERALVGNKEVGVDFFPTPPAVVQRVIEQADIRPGMRVLEPSAGKGDLAEAARDAADDVTVDTVELSSTLRDILDAKGFEPVGHDFLEHTSEPVYDRIVMNPPFGNDNGAAHVRHAFGMLKPGGRLVAIMGAGQRGKAEFDTWLESVGGIAEPLPEGSFKSSFRPTGVATQVVVIDKADGGDQGAKFSRRDSAVQDGTGQRAEQVRRAIGPIVSRWGAAAPEVVVVDAAQDLPQVIRAEQGWEGVEGWYDDSAGTVYLVAGNLASDERARRVLAHEAVGHYGIEAIVGEGEWAQIRDTVYRMMKSGQHPELFAELARRYRGVNEGLFVREAVAVMAEKGMGRGIVSRVVAAIRRFLRGIGFDLEFSERELRDLIGKSARYLRNGRRPRVAPEAGQAMAFAARPDRDWNAKVQVVGIAGGAFGDTNAVRQARAAAKNYLTRLRDSGHLMQNADTGWKIGLSRASINELVQFDQEKLNLLIALPRITNVAVLADSAPNRNPAAQGESIVAYHTLYAPVALNGEPRIARLVVQEHAGGRYAFDLQQSGVLNAQGPAGVARFPGVESGARRPGEAHAWTVGQLRDAVNAVNRPGWAFSQVADTFYSAMAESVATGKGAPKKGTAEQWKGWLDGAQRRGEFKQAERDWLGVDEWLAQQDGPVSREALADYVRANAVQVQDVVLGGPGAPSLDLPDGWVVEDDGDGGFVVLDDDGDERGFGATAEDAVQNAQDTDERSDAIAGGSPKFASYQLPGGENYRELLLTLPPKAGRSLTEIEREWSDMPVSDPRWQALADERQAAIRAAMPDGKFHSSHFDEPNILAHVRYNERTDADGRRVLFIEEIQSDWHQAGRKRGYSNSAKATRALEDLSSDELIEILRTNDPNGEWDGGEFGPIGRDAALDQIREWQSDDPTFDVSRFLRDKANTDGVPNAPFKATDEWAMLAFKRMVRHAAENGFDRIAWTTGEQQAERYDLSKQVEKVAWSATPEGVYRVDFMPVGAPMQNAAADATESDLAGIVGKEIADKIISAWERGDTSGTLSGEGLKIGGSGMRGFYDKILPSAVNKWAKRFGGRVGLARIPSYDKGTGRKHLFDTAEVHAIDLTPAMRDAAMAGQPLFSRAPAEESVIAADTAFVAGLSAKERKSPAMAAFAEGLWRTEGTASPFFQHWFGESKVVDAAGKPLKVYHGTNEEFAAFDPKRLGKSTNHMTAALGIFTDARQDKARHYAEIASNNVPAEQQVYELYLSVQNPYRMGKDEFMAIDSIDAARETRARLQREGFDGIQLYDIGQWVVFSPEQIKRTDNRGTFDGGDARLRFSRPDPAKVLDAMDTRSVPDSVFDKLREWWSRGPISSTVENTRPSWLGALTLRHLAELGKDIKLGQVDDYAKRVQQMATDRNGLQEAGAKVAEGWEKFQKADRAGADATANLMHDTTIAAVDPSRAYVPLMTGATKRGGSEAVTAESIARRIAMVDADLDADPSEQMRRGLVAERAGLEALLAEEQARVQAYPELVRRYQALPEQGRQVYQSARQVYDDQSAALRDAIIARVKDSVESGDVRDAYIAQVRQTFEDARVRGPYFPLARFGEFWINAEKDGKPAFFMYENVQEWRAGQTDLARRGYVVKEAGRKIAEARSVAGVSSAFMADLEGVLKQSGADKQVMDDVWQMYLRTLPDLSMRKHFIHRKKVEGYSGDALRAFSGNVFHGSYQIARVRHSHKLVELLDSLKKATAALAGDDPERAAKAAALTTELGQRHEWVMNPKDSKAVSWLTSLGFVWYLGATPAAAAVNLTQTAIVTFPVLASRFGVAKAWNTLAAATGRALRNVNGDLTRGLNDEERAAFALWEKSGAIDRTMAHNLAGLSETDTRSFNPVARRTMELVSLMFHKAEVVNREATALAAFRLARDAGQDFHTAVQYAADVITESHFDYTNANRARWMQSNAAKVLLLFRQYSLNMTWFLWRNFYLGTKGETPAVRKEARKKLAGVLGMTALFAGVMGLPLMGLMFDLANAAAAAFGDDDDPFDAEVEFRNFLADLLGPDLARFITQGPIESLTGIEFGSRVGLNELWLRSPDRELEGQAMADYLLEQAAGPVVGGMLVNTLRGGNMIAEGNTWRGIETMSPKSVKDGMKALRYGKEGVNTMRGDPLIEDLSLGETLMQLAGFTPADVTERYDANSAAKNYEQRILGRRRALLNAYAMAWRAEDADGIQKALGKIQAWNTKHPAMGITLDTIRRSLASRMRYSARAESGVVLDRRIAEDAREQARFGL